MWIKMCGITRLEDAVYAEEIGVDAIGFIFAKSPRTVTPEQAKGICSQTKQITKIGVFVNEPMENIQRIKSFCKLDLVQLHGDENAEFCSAFGETCIKALRVKSSTDLSMIDQFNDSWKIVLDAFIPGMRGGTGKTIQMDLLHQIKKPDRIIIAGGLNPENIKSILSSISPFGVDVSSGIEQSPGIKDHKKMYEFINQIRGINA